MNIFDAILNALFVMAVVFAVLATLYFLIVIFAAIFRNFNKAAPIPAAEPAGGSSLASPVVPVPPEADYSAGTLKLKDVDEKTAAMIMAVVSDESGIPLSELCFKSIRLVQK